MAAIALLIRESGRHSRPVGVLVLTLSGMLLLHPAWARSIGFQLSAAATAGAEIFQLTAWAFSCGAGLRTGAAPNNGCVNKREQA